MRVCVLTSSFPCRSDDTAGTFVYSQVTRLADVVRIDVVHAQRDGLHPYAAEAFVRRPVHNPFRTRHMSRVRGFDSVHAVPLCASMVRAAFVGGPYDLYHAYWAIPAGFVGSLVKGRRPLVVWLGGSDINVFSVRPGFREAVRWSLRCATRVIAVSHDLLEKAISLGLDPRRGTVIPSGVDTDLFRPVDSAIVRRRLGLPDGFLFVCVGSLLPGKRVDRLIRIVAGLPRGLDCFLIVVGDGPERQTLEQTAAEAAGRVVFLGHLANNCVAEVVAACDAFVMASESEGLPTSVQEAMSCGLPVVAMDVGGLHEIVIDGEVGFLARDEAQMHHLMRKMATASAGVPGMGDRARSLAQTRLSVDLSVQRTLEVYRQALEETG